MKREVYAEIAEVNDIERLINSRVELPKMKVCEINKLVDIMKLHVPMPIVKTQYGLSDHTFYECPNCRMAFSESGLEEYKYCYKCGQALDTKNFAL